MAIVLLGIWASPVQNGGVYGNGATESGLGFAARTAGTDRRYGRLSISSGGTGEPGQDYFAECFRQDEPADCASHGTHQRDGGQVAAAILGAGCFRVT